MDLQFPIDPNTNKASSVLFGKNVIANSLLQVNPTAATNVLHDKQFRTITYQQHILKTLEEGEVWAHD